MRKARLYPSYKYSGIEWVGNVPGHWVVKPLKHAINFVEGPGIMAVDFTEKGIPLLRIAGIGGRTATLEGCNFLSPDLVKKKWRHFRVRSGDLLISGSASTGFCSEVDENTEGAIPYTGIIIVRIKPSFTEKDFIRWFFLSQQFLIQTELLKTGSTIQHFGPSHLSRMAMLLPPKAEQHAISCFLDIETAKIDTLIEKKEKLIDLLKEKRFALISQAVTRGLDPDIRLKESGADWIGKIPEHWQIKRVKYIATVRYGLGEPPGYSDEGLAFVRATDIYRGKINLDVVRKVDPADVPWHRRPTLAENEILVVRSGAYTGDSAIVTKEVAGSIAGYDMVLTVGKAVPHFVAWVLLSKYMLEGQIHLSRMRAAQPHLNAEELGGFLLLLPPASEQQAIADYLEQETATLDRLIEKILSGIELLKEYRTSLVSSAVTGRIDVRTENSQSYSG